MQVVVVSAGAVALIAICGPQDLASTLSRLLRRRHSGRQVGDRIPAADRRGARRHSDCPALLIIARSLRRRAPQDPAHLTVQLRQNWYASAALVWVGSLIIGILVGWLIITRL